MELIDSRGGSRVRELKNFRKFHADASYLVFYVIDPVEYRYTAYLVYDYFDSEHRDDQWLYRPREKRSQRIAETARREAFLGSDFTIDDVKKIFRIEIEEYEWERKGEGEVDGRPVILVEQRPATPKLAKNLGVSRIVNHVDPESWRRLKVEYWDVSGKALKVSTLDTRGSGEPGMVMRNLQSGHKTAVTFLESEYDEELDDELFSLRGIERERVK
jgi:hypothetical protein